MSQLNSTERLSWRLNQLAKASGLSVPFLRNEVKAGRLKIRRIGKAIIVLDADARQFLSGESGEDKNT